MFCSSCHFCLLVSVTQNPATGRCIFACLLLVPSKKLSLMMTCEDSHWHWKNLARYCLDLFLVSHLETHQMGCIYNLILDCQQPVILSTSLLSSFKMPIAFAVTSAGQTVHSLALDTISFPVLRMKLHAFVGGTKTTKETKFEFKYNKCKQTMSHPFGL